MTLRRLLAVAVLPFTMSCGDRIAAPDNPVASLTVEPGSVELQFGDTVRLSATARSASGEVVRDARVTWASSNPSVVSVDSTGQLTATGGGTATVTASAGGRTAQVAAAATAWNIAPNAVVVDSTVMRLVSDSSEMAAGVLRFEFAPGAPIPAPGEVIVGAQGLGFLRRVTAASVSGNTLTVETSHAALAEIVRHGRLQARTSLGLEGAATAPALRRQYPATRVTPMEVVYAAEGVSVTAAGLDLSNVDFCKLISCPSQVRNFKLESGSIGFSPEVDLDATFEDHEVTAFHGVATGALTLDFDVLLEAQAAMDLAKQKATLATVSSIFYAQIGAVPVVAQITFDITASFSSKATVKGRILAGFQNQHTVRVGARYSVSGGWEGVYETERTFDAREPSIGDSTLVGHIELQARAAVTPELSLKLYGVAGPFVNVEPFGQTTLKFGTDVCGIKAEGGIDSTIGFKIGFLSSTVASFDHTFSPVSWPGLDWSCPLGTIDVSTITNGAETDPDGYTVLLDGETKGTVASTGSLLLPWVPVGQREVQLAGVANNCIVQGANPRTVSVATGLIEPVAFTVDCTATTGRLRVHAATSGSNQDLDGYTVTIDGTQSQAIDSNGTVTFDGLAEGARLVALQDVAPNCTVEDNPRPETISAGVTVETTFEVVCSAHELKVTTVTSGEPVTGTYYTVVVDDDRSQSINHNGTATFDISPGMLTVELKDVPYNCTVSGENPRTVNATSGGAETTFSVSCVTGSLEVRAKTAGDPGVTTYIATLNGTVQRTLAVDGGSATFDDLPAGSHSVELSGVPDRCALLGTNPRTVTVPGSTTFEVDCNLGTGEIAVRCAWPGGGSSICLVREDGTGFRNISGTSGGEHQHWPTWSPEGQSLAFECSASNTPGDSRALCTVNADGSERMKLFTMVGDTSFGYPAWSPDGSRIAMRYWYLLNPNDPDLGPTYRRVIATVTAGGAGPVSLFSDAARDEIWAQGNPSWSPDGSLVAFVGYRWRQPGDVNAIYLVPAGGGTPTRIGLPEHMPLNTTTVRWSPSGEWLLFVTSDPCNAAGTCSGAMSFAVIRPDGSDLHPISYGHYSMGAGSFDWSADGTLVLFNGYHPEGGHGLWRMKADGTDLVMIPGAGDHPAWRPAPMPTPARRE